MKLASPFSLVFVLAMAASAMGAEPPATPVAGDADTNAAVVLDNTSLWRQFHVSRNAFVRHDDGRVVPYHIDYARFAGPLDGGAGERPHCSPLPPADWAGISLGDGTLAPHQIKWSSEPPAGWHSLNTVSFGRRGRRGWKQNDPSPVSNRSEATPEHLLSFFPPRNHYELVGWRCVRTAP